MNYFNLFPTISYTLHEQVNGNVLPVNRTVPNMTIKLRLENFQKDIEGVPFITYRIREGERPDTIAVKHYGSSEFVWIIFIANNMRNWFDWPMTSEEFPRYIAKKYESSTDALDGIVRSQRIGSTIVDSKFTVNTSSNILTATVGSTYSLTASMDIELSNSTATIPVSIDSVINSTSARLTFIPSTGIASGNAAILPLQETKYFQIIDNVRYEINRKTYLSTPSSRRVLQTAYEQEEAANENRREIRLIEPKIVTSIQRQFQKLMRT